MISKSKRIQDPLRLGEGHLPLLELPLPQYFYYPLLNTRCKEGSTSLKEGDRVLVGEKIGSRNGGFFTQDIFSTVSGKFVGIEKHGYRNGAQIDCIKIESDGKFERHPSLAEREGYASITKEELVQIAKDRALVGLGGSSFPTYIKLDAKDKIDHITINAIECEPYLHSDIALLAEHAETIVEMCEILLRIYEAKDATICIKKTHAEEIRLLSNILALKGSKGVSIATLEHRYPQGWEVAMINDALGMSLEPGTVPSKFGVLNINVSSAYALYRAIRYNEPILNRLVCFQGDALKEPFMASLPVGCLLSDVLTLEGNDDVLLWLGGPMMGTALGGLDCILSPTVTNVLALKARPRVAEQPCVHCASCVLSCPANLQPAQIVRYVKKHNVKALKAFEPLRCVECGLCTYSCPSQIRVHEYVKMAKGMVK